MQVAARVVFLLFVRGPNIMAGDPIFSDTEKLTWNDDLSVRMVDSIHLWLDKKLEESVEARQKYWQLDLSSVKAYRKSIESNRAEFRRLIGVVDDRLPPHMEEYGQVGGGPVAASSKVTAHQVRWDVLDGVKGEGLLLKPKGQAKANVIVLPDADQRPEQLAGLSPLKAGEPYALHLAESGCVVLIPQLVSRANDFSGHPAVGKTNQPHREWIYRQAFQMGRHIIGYEVQRVMAAVDWFATRARGETGKAPRPVMVTGYAEGGLIAMYSAAVDERITACLVSGFFNRRESVWKEPIYRNIWGHLERFGGAEIAALVAPRTLFIEHSAPPRVMPPRLQPNGHRGGAAPGTITTPRLADIQSEIQRFTKLSGKYGRAELIVGAESEPVIPCSSGSLERLLNNAGIKLSKKKPLPLSAANRLANPTARQKRLVEQLTDHVQQLERFSGKARDRYILEGTDRSTAKAFMKDADAFRDYFSREVIGYVDSPLAEMRPRIRKVYDRKMWTGYEVVLDVLPGFGKKNPPVFAWGILCVPKGIRKGEQRPVVVCQHGLEGVPKDTIERSDGYPAYKAYAARLAEKGFITFAPHNPYRGLERFRMVQRKANPLKLSLFSFIVRQHEQILNWLESLPFVDNERVAFYGLSYGGKTAMRVPAILRRYCLSICSADFNDWVKKIVSVEARFSYQYTVEWELMEFNLGHTFNYAEMAYLIFPRPFMVERGHDDGVSIDEWVAYEYAKIRRFYNKLGRGDDTEIEFFDGPHTINGQQTFRFLEKHLKWPGKSTR